LPFKISDLGGSVYPRLVIQNDLHSKFQIVNGLDTARRV
jgi:hypothetical protein